MAAYKQKYEEAMSQVALLEAKIEEMTQLDSMCARLTDEDAKNFVLTFADRCQNRAEVSMLLRVINRLGA